MDLSRMLNEKKISLVLVPVCALMFYILYTSREEEVFVSYPPNLPIDKQIWALYEGGYGNMETDGNWGLWGKHLGSNKPSNAPPTYIPSQLYPQLGTYSSHDPSVIRTHCYQMAQAGINGIMLNWNGINTEIEDTLKLLLDQSIEFGLHVGIAISNYPDRTNQTIYDDIIFIQEKYAQHQAFLKIHNMPVFIIVDSHEIQLMFHVINLVRNTTTNAYLITNFGDQRELGIALESGFDGITTLSPATDAKMATTLSNWKEIHDDCLERDLLFVPTVSPGHNGTKYYNFEENVRSRENGSYYERMWNTAIQLPSTVILINSFNNWLEATQIEPAMNIPDYSFNEMNWCSSQCHSDYYLVKTKELISKFLK